LTAVSSQQNQRLRSYDVQTGTGFFQDAGRCSTVLQILQLISLRTTMSFQVLQVSFLVLVNWFSFQRLAGLGRKRRKQAGGARKRKARPAARRGALKF
jgi:hypothetical protein